MGCVLFFVCFGCCSSRLPCRLRGLWCVGGCRAAPLLVVVSFFAPLGTARRRRDGGLRWWVGLESFRAFSTPGKSFFLAVNRPMVSQCQARAFYFLFFFSCAIGFAHQPHSELLTKDFVAPPSEADATATIGTTPPRADPLHFQKPVPTEILAGARLLGALAERAGDSDLRPARHRHILPARPLAVRSQPCAAYRGYGAQRRRASARRQHRPPLCVCRGLPSPRRRRRPSRRRPDSPTATATPSPGPGSPRPPATSPPPPAPAPPPRTTPRRRSSSSSTMTPTRPRPPAPPPRSRRTWCTRGASPRRRRRTR